MVDDDDLMDQLTERSHTSAVAKQVGTDGRYLVAIPEGVEPGDLIVIEIKPSLMPADPMCRCHARNMTGGDDG
jgi:hypothetical protein